MKRFHRTPRRNPCTQPEHAARTRSPWSRAGHVYPPSQLNLRATYVRCWRLLGRKRRELSWNVTEVELKGDMSHAVEPPSLDTESSWRSDGNGAAGVTHSTTSCPPAGSHSHISPPHFMFNIRRRASRTTPPRASLQGPTSVPTQLLLT